MRKEVLVAIVLSVAFGLIIGYGVWRANAVLKVNKINKAENVVEEIKDVSPTPKDSQITLNGITSGDVVSENPYRLSGNTIPNTRVVVSAEEDDYIMISDDNGDFAEEVELVGGENQIIIYVFSEAGQFEESINIVFSSEFGDKEEAETPKEDEAEE